MPNVLSLFDHKSNGQLEVGLYWHDTASGSWSQGHAVSVAYFIGSMRIYYRMMNPYKTLSWGSRR